MTETSSTILRRRRSTLIRKLPPLSEIIRGSLIERYKRCGKPNCKCVNGPGHGPKYYLSVTPKKGRAQMDYVPLDYHDQVAEFLGNYRSARQVFEEICEINRELLRRREKL